MFCYFVITSLFPVTLSQAQLVVLSVQISWSESTDKALTTIAQNGGKDMKPLVEVLTTVKNTLQVLADSVLQEQPPVRRKKLEHLVSTGDISGIQKTFVRGCTLA